MPRTARLRPRLVIATVCLLAATALIGCGDDDSESRGSDVSADDSPDPVAVALSQLDASFYEGPVAAGLDALCDAAGGDDIEEFGEAVRAFQPADDTALARLLGALVTGARRQCPDSADDVVRVADDLYAVLGPELSPTTGDSAVTTNPFPDTDETIATQPG